MISYYRCSGGQDSAMNSLRSALTPLRAAKTRPDMAAKGQAEVLC